MQILKFSASWCGPCKSLLAALTKYPSLEIVEVDIDENPTAKPTWGLRSVPTLIAVDDDNKEVDRMIGFSSSQQLADFIKRVGT